MISTDTTSHRDPATSVPSHRGVPSVETAIRGACARIAPTWPLDRFIAVNPLWGMIDLPLSVAAAKLQSLSGARMLMPRAWYRQAHREGRLRDEHLLAAIESTNARLELGHLHALLEEDEPATQTRPIVADVVDAGRDLVHEPSWRSVVTHGVSQFCAAYFDEGQAQLGPSREGGLYASWRRHAATDRGPALLMGVPHALLSGADLPPTAIELVAVALAGLGVAPEERESYLWSLLLDQNGWASWCAYRRWTARLAGSDDDAISDLLAIRLAWEWMLFRAGGVAVARRWAVAMASWPQVDDAAAASRASDWLFQRALEIASREPILRALPAGFPATRPASVAVQAVFCIDVRSEVFRRALEGAAPSVQTLGFAGFFGVPMEYQPLGSPAARPQLPGLLAPRLRAADTGLGADAEAARARHFDLAGAWGSFRRDAVSTFAFVEAIGVAYAGKLVADGLGWGWPLGARRAGLTREVEAACKPRLVASAGGEPLALEARCDLAAGMLRGMSLTRDFAKVVLLVGHGSSTRNNPHAAGLDCGACCGQTGEANARVAAALLNDPEVREGLAARNVPVPEGTWFVPALHDTTTDEVALFDLDEVPATLRGELDTLREWLREAGAVTRAERAATLGIHASNRDDVRRAVRARTTDWAQVRAEWGLAGNAAFIVGPRERFRHLDLRGRSFLHEYRHEEDEGFAVLEAIMTAPMLVTHWINFQYYASTVDNVRYGSGNKVLHNVVGGHLGVFEGNGGDLRIGLPLQSVHDGTRFVHTPVRLSVFIDAPRDAIDGVMEKHANVRALVDHGWVWLFQVDPAEGSVYERRGGRWHLLEQASQQRGATS